MTDIPDDIMKAAREICADNFRGRGLHGFAMSAMDGSLDAGASIPIAVAAIIAERKRCAEVVSDLVSALQWMIDNDETHEGDEPMEKYGGKSWNEINSYWIDGLSKARTAIVKAGIYWSAAIMKGPTT